jgi:hypothetical protein
MSRWEQGSEFDKFDYSNTETPNINPWQNPCYASCGRDALKLLLLFGKKQFGWNKLWIPNYYCKEVVDSLVSIKIELCFYEDSPLSLCFCLPDNLQSSDVVLLVNYFGIRTKRFVNCCNFGDAITIEDHTHDPWSNWAYESKANYCFASLRKTLPIPNGAVIWSPLESSLPLEPTIVKQEVVDTKNKAMTLKYLYLKGHKISKKEYRELQLKGESLISSKEISGIDKNTLSIIDAFPIKQWREQRLCNYNYLTSKNLNLEVLKPMSISCCPFSVILVLDNKEQQDYIRSKLISKKIYPAILWPNNKDTNNLSNRILSICCDMRYSLKDMDKIYKVIKHT